LKESNMMLVKNL